VQLDKRPLLAGILFGLLAYKPQFGLMIPLVLIATGRWRTVFAAGRDGRSARSRRNARFGVETWRAFFTFAEYTRTVVLETGETGWHKIQSVFAWARMWGAPVPLAYAVQGAVTLGIGAALVWLWRTPSSFALKAAALCLAAILATPYSLDYDLMVLAPAIAFLAADGRRARLRPVGENRAGVPLDRAADRTWRRASHADPARRHRHAVDVRAPCCAVRTGRALRTGSATAQ
jgi:hypothetical protein